MLEVKINRLTISVVLGSLAICAQALHYFNLQVNKACHTKLRVNIFENRVCVIDEQAKSVRHYQGNTIKNGNIVICVDLCMSFVPSPVHLCVNLVLAYWLIPFPCSHLTESFGLLIFIHIIQLKLIVYILELGCV